MKERVTNLIQIVADDPSKVSSVAGVISDMFIEFGNVNGVTNYAASQSLSTLSSVSFFFTRILSDLFSIVTFSFICCCPMHRPCIVITRSSLEINVFLARLYSRISVKVPRMVISLYKSKRSSRTFSIKIFKPGISILLLVLRRCSWI